MKVTGTRARERRRDKRTTVRPITVELDGKSYETVDWSLGGFMIEPYEGDHMPGDRVYVRVTVYDGRDVYCHPIEVEVIRLDPKYGELGAHFLNIDDDTFTTLEGWIAGRLSRDALSDDGDG